MKNILVIGTGGNSKVNFIYRLNEMFEQVFVIDCSSSAPTEYPQGVYHFKVPSLTRHELLEILPNIPSLKDCLVTTIYEAAIESAAFVREWIGTGTASRYSSQIFRNKWEMAKWLEKNNIIIPPTKCWPCEKNDFSTTDLVVRPNLGYGNLGVRIIRKDRISEEYILSLQRTIENHSQSDSDYNSINDCWLVSERIFGIEVEVDIVCVREKIIWTGIHEKTLIRKVGEKLEENNAVTPPISLSKNQLAVLNVSCEELARNVYNDLHRPCGREQFCLYVEFIISEENCYCIEMADRIGGGFVPWSLEKACGIDLFRCAALVTSNKIEEYISNLAKISRAVYWQLIYSPKLGVFRGLEGVDTSEMYLLELKENGSKILVPQTDFVAAIGFVGKDGETSDSLQSRILDSIRNLRIKIEDTANVVWIYSVPIPNINYRA